jgi:hypothetical protein
MAHVQHNGKLNQLLIDLGRSLLQYVGQCSSWAGQNPASIEQEFNGVVAQQQHEVAQLVDLLMQRHWTIDFGVFPPTYTDLHFLALKYLLKQILENQQLILAELDESVHTCVDDPEAVSLINEILASERKITEQLQSLVAPAPQAAA